MSAPAPAPAPAGEPNKTTAPPFPGGHLRRFWESLAPLIFPPVCVLCGDATGLATAKTSTRRYATFCRVCETALAQSRPMMRTACDQCGWPRAVRSPRHLSRGSPAGPPDEIADEFEIASGPPTQLPCRRCQARPRPHRFSRIVALYRYHDVARNAVVAAKYPLNSAVTQELAVRLAQGCRERWPDLTTIGEAGGGSRENSDGGPIEEPAAVPTIVTSVPSPWIRQVRRNGSGTRLLAQYTAKNLGIPYVNLMQTTRSVAKQALLDDDGRRDNVRGAFRVSRRWRKTKLDCDIVLVDDVMTTGATADEVAGVLIDAGAHRVSLAVVALAMRDG